MSVRQYFIDFFDKHTDSKEMKQYLILNIGKVKNIDQLQDADEIILSPILERLHDTFPLKHLQIITNSKDENKVATHVVNILEVNIPNETCKYTLTDLIELIEKPEVMSVTDGNITKQTFLQIDQGLIVHLGRKKVDKFLNVHIQVDFEFRNLYLNAIICANIGHYWICAKRKTGWYKFNMGKLQLINTTTVLQEINTHGVIFLYEKYPKIDDIQAFVLDDCDKFCYYNAALQFLYTSIYFRNEIKEPKCNFLLANHSFCKNHVKDIGLHCYLHATEQKT